MVHLNTCVAEAGKDSAVKAANKDTAETTGKILRMDNSLFMLGSGSSTGKGMTCTGLPPCTVQPHPAPDVPVRPHALKRTVTANNRHPLHPTDHRP